MTARVDPAEPAFQVLFVDDEPFILRALARMLKDEGYGLHFATDAAEAFAVAERVSLDVIASDLRMPGPDGHVVLERLRAMHPHVVRILMSAHVLPEEALDDDNVQRFLSKPWEPARLRRLLREAADCARERREALQQGAPAHLGEFRRAIAVPR